MMKNISAMFPPAASTALSLPKAWTADQTMKQ